MDWKYLLTSFSGRINRAKFWAGVLVLLAVNIIGNILDMAIGTYSYESGIGIISAIFVLATLVPVLAVYAKRWHDRNKSGWWTLIVLIPLIGQLWALIELGFLRGTEGANRFGPDPLA